MPLHRPPIAHVVLLDGTLASRRGRRATHIATIRRLVLRAGSQRGPDAGPGGEPGGGPGGRMPVRVHYGRGLQWDDWRSVMTGRGIEDRIATAYGWLASSWRPGDPIFVFGYSRGAFAARSLAGMIARVGLLRPRHATERNIRVAWRIYRDGASDAVRAGLRRRCHPQVPVDMLGLFDTVAALGVRLPLLWMLTEGSHRFHSHGLAPHVRFGAHALALDETRAAFFPILWADHPKGRVEQRWFRGSHADIGGQLDGCEECRPLANIPLVWMLEKAAAQGLPLPPDWREGLATDVTAPSMGTWYRWGRVFLLRAPRTVGTAGDRLHESVPLPYGGPALVIDPERIRRSPRGAPERARLSSRLQAMRHRLRRRSGAKAAETAAPSPDQAT